MPLKIFLDTNVLLKGFGASRGKQALPAYLTDSFVDRHLCDDFGTFLEKHAITVLSYGSAFNVTRSIAFASVHPAMLDSFVRDTLIPNEDFEIVFAALSLPVDVFVTDDLDLITCSWSLGLNFPLTRDSFCKGDDYLATLEKIKIRKGILDDL